MTNRIVTAAKSRKEQAVSRSLWEKIVNIALLVAGIGLILVSVLWLLLANPYVKNTGPVRIGRELKDFSLTDVNGKTVHLSDYKGKPILINAWATWCPPCKAEMPLLNQYYQSHTKDGFVLLAVNAGDSREVTATFVIQSGLAFPVLLDPGSQLLDSMAIISFPTSILVGRDGKVKSIHAGEFTSDSLESEVTPFLKD